MKGLEQNQPKLLHVRWTCRICVPASLPLPVTLWFLLTANSPQQRYVLFFLFHIIKLQQLPKPLK